MKVREAVCKLESRLDARVLLAYVLGYSAAKLIARSEEELSPRKEAEFLRLAARRRKGEPVAMIIGRKEFYGREFFVDNSTLVPRPDTETLIEAVKSELPADFSGRFLDIGVGTGALLLTLLAEFPNAGGIGTDIVPEACALARKNARALGVEGRAEIIEASYMPPGEFDVVVSNPPYIRTSDMAWVEKDVLDFEPASALDGGLDGLDAYRSIAAQVLPEQKIFLEINEDQAADVREIFARPAKVFKDLSGRDRVLYFS